MNKNQEKIIYDYLLLICNNENVDNIKIKFVLGKNGNSGNMTSTWDKWVDKQTDD